MKRLNKIIISSLGFLVIMMGCDTKALHDLNINPQAVNEIDMNYLFTEVELGIAAGGSAGDNRYLDWRTNILWCSTIIQQLATTTSGQYGAGDKYFDNQEVYHAPWRFWYTDVLKNAHEVIKQTGEGGFEEGEKMNTRQAARIIQAFTFARLTDFYGNIPYTEANQGISGTFFPTYDTQADIYPQILAQLADAASKISASNPDDGFSDADFIFNGDISKWKKWAYSLLLRYAMRVSDVDPNMADTYVQQAIAGGVMSSNDDNVWCAMADGPGEWTNQNGISRAFAPGDGGEADFFSETMMNFLKGVNPNDSTDDDPRLKILSGGIGDWTTLGFFPVAGGTKALNQRGMPNGYNHSDLVDLLGLDQNYINEHVFSRINPKMLDDSDPYMIMNVAETEFLLAEAAEKGIGGATNAQAHFEAGVRDAMQMYEPYFANDDDFDGTVTDAMVDNYLANYPYGGGGVSGSESNLEQIAYQLWASHFLNWFEAWNDWRRVGMPVLQATNYPNNLTGGVIPRRLRYPNDEVSDNPNYQDGATLPNDLLTKVWWDVGDVTKGNK